MAVRLRPGQDLRRELLAVADDRLRFDREPDPETGDDELVVRHPEESPA